MGFTVRRKGEAVGTVAVTENARAVTFEVRCPKYYTLEVLRCYGVAVGAAPPLLLGVLEPEGGGLYLRRTLTRQSLAQAGFGAALPQSYELAGANDTVETPPEPVRREAECPPPAPPQAPLPIETGDPLIDAAAAAGSVQVERDGARLKVACIFDPCAPCPLAFAFTGCRVETRGDQKFLLLEFISPDYGTAKDVE